MVVTQPGFVYWNGEAYGQRVEPSLLPHLYAVGALDRAGVPLAFGSDAPVTDPNPWPTIYSAVTRATNQGGTLPPKDSGDSVQAGMGQGIAVARALRLHTLGGAWAEGTQDRKGTIRPGKLADLVLLDTDPIRAAPSKLKDIRAVLTVVGRPGCLGMRTSYRGNWLGMVAAGRGAPGGGLGQTVTDCAPRCSRTNSEGSDAASH